MSREPPRKENSSANQDGYPTELTTRTKCNKRQRQLYNKRRRAKKVQLKAQNNHKKNASQAPAVVTKSDP